MSRHLVGVLCLGALLARPVGAGDADAHVRATARASLAVRNEFPDGVGAPQVQGKTVTGLFQIPVDVQIIDGAVNGAAQVAGLLGSTLRYLQSGLARSYVAVLVFGALLIIGYFVIK